MRHMQLQQLGAVHSQWLSCLINQHDVCMLPV
jgi:hypothetical protein